ncbi:MAG: hypothetical protein ACI8UO_004566 [Verrucomicrobiales bacterium]|jgi:hypothetical protein
MPISSKTKKSGAFFDKEFHGETDYVLQLIVDEVPDASVPLAIKQL